MLTVATLLIGVLFGICDAQVMTTDLVYFESMEKGASTNLVYGFQGDSVSMAATGTITLSALGSLTADAISTATAAGGDCATTTTFTTGAAASNSIIITLADASNSAVSTTAATWCTFTIPVTLPSSAAALTVQAAFSTAASGGTPQSAANVDVQSAANVLASEITLTDSISLDKPFVGSTDASIYYTFNSNVELPSGTVLEMVLPDFAIASPSAATVIDCDASVSAASSLDITTSLPGTTLTITTGGAAISASTECTFVLTGSTFTVPNPGSAGTAVSFANMGYLVSVHDTSGIGRGAQAPASGTGAGATAAAATTFTDSVSLLSAEQSGTSIDLLYTFRYISTTAADLAIGSVIRLMYAGATGGSVSVSIVDCDNGGSAPTFSVTEYYSGSASYYIDLAVATNDILYNTDCSVLLSGFTNPAATAATSNFYTGYLLYSSGDISGGMVLVNPDTNSFGSTATQAWTLSSDSMTLSTSTAGATGVTATVVFTLTGANTLAAGTFIAVRLPGFSSPAVGGDFSCTTASTVTGTVTAEGFGDSYMVTLTTATATISTGDTCTLKLYNLINACDGGTPKYEIFGVDGTDDYIALHEVTTVTGATISSASSSGGVVLAGVMTFFALLGATQM